MVMSKDMGGMGGGGRGGRTSGGITGKGGVNVNPKYKEVGPTVKVIKPGSKLLTIPNNPYHGKAIRTPDELKRMGL
jgi:hypothetical protein